MDMMTTGSAADRPHLSSSPFKAQPARAIEEFSVGDRVTHDKHGLGTVLSHDTSTITVAFGAQRIRIASPFARMTKI